MGSAHRLHYDLYRASKVLADPGNGGTITVTQDLMLTEMVSGASNETRTLTAPTKSGIRHRLRLLTDGGGNVVLTATGGLDVALNTVATFANAGDTLDLMSVAKSGGYRWDVQGIPTAPITTAAEHGAGVIGTAAAPVTYRRVVNGIIITEFKIDLTGLASVATANDVIGLAAGGNAYIGRNVVATNGIIFKMELICVEATAGGDDDVNVVVNSSGTLAYDGAGGTTYGINGGNAAAGQVVQNLVQGLTADHYFYLTAGTGDTAAAYTAGQFIVRWHGHPLL